MSRLLALLTASLFLAPVFAQEAAIVHDGEFQFLRQQHGDRWDKEDKEIDKMLSAIRAKHGGKRPNILYILLMPVEDKFCIDYDPDKV